MALLLVLAMLLGNAAPALAAGEGIFPSSSAAILPEDAVNPADPAAIPSDGPSAADLDETASSAENSGDNAPAQTNTAEAGAPDSTAAQTAAENTFEEKNGAAAVPAENSDAQSGSSETAPAQITPSETASAEMQPAQTGTDPAQICAGKDAFAGDVAAPSVLKDLIKPGGSLKAPTPVTGGYEVSSWEDLQAAVILAATGRPVTIKLTKDLIAATIADNVPKGTITIPANKNIILTADSRKTIYRNGAGNDTDFSMFKVANGGKLTIGNNVTLSGAQATMVTSTTTTTVTDGSGLQIKNGDDILYLHNYPGMTPPYQLHFGDYETDTLSRVVNTQRWVVEMIPGTSEFYIKNAQTGHYLAGIYTLQYKYGQYGSERVHTYKMGLYTNPEATNQMAGRFVRLQNGQIVLKTSYGNMTLGRDQQAVWATPGSEGSYFGYSPITITVVTETVTALNNPALYWKNSGVNGGNRRTFTGNFSSSGSGRGDKGFFVTVEQGGELTITGNAVLEKFKTTYSNNEVPKGVAPVYSEGTVTMTGGEIRDNHVSYTMNKNGQPAELYDYPEHSVTGNPMKQNSGDGQSFGGWQVINRANQFNNREMTSAGAIRAEGGQVNISGNAVIRDNKSHTGAVSIANRTASNKTNMNMSGGLIQNNYAVSGGTVLVTAGTAMNMTGGTIDNNKNWFGGGVLAVSRGAGENDEQAVFIMNGANAQISRNESRSTGGGVLVYSNQVVLKQGRINQNISHVFGGGVYVYGMDNPRGTESPLAFTLVLDYAGIHDNLATYSGRQDQANRANRESSALDKYYFSRYQKTENGVTYGQSDSRINYNGDINRFTSGSGGGLWLCPQGALKIETETVHLIHNDADVHGDDLFKDNGFGGGIVVSINKDVALHHDWFHDWALRKDQGTVTNEGGATARGTGEVRQYPVNYYDYWMLNLPGNAGAAGTRTPSQLRALGTDNHNSRSSYNPRDVFQDDEGRLSDVEGSYGYRGALALTNHYNREYAKYGLTACTDYSTPALGYAPVQIYDNVSRRGGGVGADGQVLFIKRNQPSEDEINSAFVDFQKKFGENAVPGPRAFRFYIKDDDFRVDPADPAKIQRRKTNGSDSWVTVDYLEIRDGEVVNTASGEHGDSYMTVSGGSVYTLHETFRLYDGTWAENNNAAYDAGYENNAYILTKTAANDTARLTLPMSALKVRRLSDGSLEKVIGDDGKFRADLFHGDGTLKREFAWANELLVKEYLTVGQSGLGEEIGSNIFHLGSPVYDSDASSSRVVISRQVSYVDHPIPGQDPVTFTTTYKITFNSLCFNMEAVNEEIPAEKYIDGKVHADSTDPAQTYTYSILAYVPLDASELVFTDTLEDVLMFVDSGNNPQFLASGSGSTENSNFNVWDRLVTELVRLDSNNHLGDGSQGASVKASGTGVTGVLKTRRNPAGNNDNGNAYAQVGSLNADGVFTPDKWGNTIRVEFPEAAMSQVRGKWVRLSFKAALRPEYRDPEILRNLGYIDDVTDKKGTMALPAWAADLNTYFNGINSSVTVGVDAATGDRILRLMEDAGHWYAMTEKSLSNGVYYEKFKNQADGHWYAVVQGTKMTDIADGTFFNSRGEFNSANPGLTASWWTDIRDWFAGTKAGASEVNLRPATQETNWPVLDGADTHKYAGNQEEQHSGTKNQADVNFTLGNGGSYTYKTNIVTFEVQTPQLSLTKNLLAQHVTYPAEGFTFTIRLWDVTRGQGGQEDVRTPVSGTFPVTFTDPHGDEVTEAGGAALPASLTFVNGTADVALLPGYTVTLKNLGYAGDALAYEITEDKSREGEPVGSEPHVGNDEEYSNFVTYFSHGSGELTGSDHAEAVCDNEEFTNYENHPEFRFEHHKTIDYLGDEDGDNPDTYLDNLDGMDLSDVYRLTLDITGKRKGVDLLLVIDRSFSMRIWKLDGNRANASVDPGAGNGENANRMSILLDYLYGTGAGDQNTAFINSFLQMNEKNRIALSWFGGHSDGSRYMNEYTTEEREDGGLSYQEAGTALPWSSISDFPGGAVPYDHSSRSTLMPMANTATDYMAGYWEALDRLMEAEDDQRQKVVVFLSDGAPTLYISPENLLTDRNPAPLRYWYLRNGYYYSITDADTKLWNRAHTQAELNYNSTATYSYVYNNTTYYHVKNGTPLTYRGVREEFGDATPALYADYLAKKAQPSNKLYLYGTGSDTNVAGVQTNILHDTIKERVSRSLDDFMFTILGHGDPGDPDYYPGIDGLKNNTSFYAISYGIEHNNADSSADVRDNDLLNRFAVSNGSEAFPVHSRSELEEALAKAIKIFPNDVTVTDQLSQYVKLHGDDPSVTDTDSILGGADTKVVMTDSETHKNTLVCEFVEDGNTGAFTLTHYVKYYEDPATGLQQLAILRGNTWKWWNNGTIGGNVENSKLNQLRPVVSTITYERKPHNSYSTGEVKVKYDEHYKMVPEYAYGLSFNVSLTPTAYTEYLDANRTYRPSTEKPAGYDSLSEEQKAKITFYRKVEGANEIYVSVGKYETLSDEEKAKFGDDPTPYYYDKVFTKTDPLTGETVEDEKARQIGEDLTDYIAYDTEGNLLYANGTSSMALGFQSNHEAQVEYTVNGSEYITDYYDRPVVQVRPRGSLVIGKQNTKGGPVDHDTEERTALFQLLPSVNGVAQEAAYVSRPIGNGNLYEFVKDENGNGLADAGETDTVITPGEYFLLESQAPANHVAVTVMPRITVSYDASGSMQVTVPEGQNLPVEGSTGAVVIGAAGSDEDLSLQNLELKTFIFGKTDDRNQPIDHTDDHTLARFILVPDPEAAGSDSLPSYVSVPVEGDNHRYTFVPAKEEDGQLVPDTDAAETGLRAGTYLMREIQAPANHRPGPDTRLVVSYDAAGGLVLTFPEGSPAAFGKAGAAVMDGASVVIPEGHVISDTSGLEEGVTSVYRTSPYSADPVHGIGSVRPVLQSGSLGEPVTLYTLGMKYPLGRDGQGEDLKAVRGVSEYEIDPFYRRFGFDFETLKKVLYYGFAGEGFDAFRGSLDAELQDISDADAWAVTQMAVIGLTQGGDRARDWYYDNLRGDYAEGSRLYADYSEALLAYDGPVPDTAAVDLYRAPFSIESATLPSTGPGKMEITRAAMVGLRIGEIFNIQNELAGVPVVIRKVNGDDRDAAIRYDDGAYEVTHTVWGGIHIKNPATNRYYYVGRDDDPNHPEYVADPFTMIDGERVLTYPVPADWKSRAVHGRPANITGNYAVYYGIDETKTAAFALIPVVPALEVVGRAGLPGRWVRLPRGYSLLGITPEHYAVDGYAYIWIGAETSGADNAVTVVANAAAKEGKLYIANESVVSQSTGTNNDYLPAGSLTVVGEYWGQNVTASSKKPAADQFAALDYWSRNGSNASRMRIDGVYVTRAEGRNGAEALYRFVKAGTPHSSTDPSDLNVPVGIYWLMETRRPDGFFNGGMPVRVEVKKVLDTVSGEFVTKLSYPDLPDIENSEILAREKYIVDAPGGFASKPGIYANMEIGFHLAYRNFELYALPSAGGPGTYLFTVLGTVALALAAYGLLLRRRRRTA